MKTFLFIIISSAFLACRIKKETYCNVELLNNGTIISKLKLADGEYEIELNLVIDTIKKMDVAQSNVTDKLITYQKLVFYKNGLKINEQIPKIPLIFQKTTDNDSISVLENFIYELGILKGIKNDVFCVQGSGHCNACPEFFAFFSLDGKCLWYQYSNRVKSYSSYGDFDEVCLKNGISSEKWRNKEYKKIEWEW